ncbi:MAG: 2-C-methyl-D-erythritol 4-phosphate cytidylyltransferase [Comamonadaceae bacterium]|nr:2-C-methyl-D-erythritol 4-phosphate cytidylyltransferase [Comamonadaceae bacterium]MDP2743274.1 2-C-methyl-D-erythritol 4-phosphate cytidylyltransferase [Hydrogenophaga sp.]
MPDRPEQFTPTKATRSNVRCHLLLPCAGSGSRAGSAQPKQYQPVAGKPLVLHTLAAFASVARLHTRLLIVAPGDASFEAETPAGVTVAACGGASRAHSVFNGLDLLQQGGADGMDWVLVHDAARCLLTPDQVNALMDACWEDDVGGLLALPLPDTLKSSTEGRVAATVDRSDKWLAQTPQMFRLGALRSAMAIHLDRGFAGVTDESSAMEMAGHRPLLVRGSAQNFKITYPEDFSLAESILRSRT